MAKASTSKILRTAAQRAKEFGSLDKEQQWEHILSQRADVYMRGKSQIGVDKSLNVSTDQLHALRDTLDDLSRLYPGPNGQGRSITVSSLGLRPLRYPSRSRTRSFRPADKRQLL
jgi:hypothetical protein